MPEGEEIDRIVIRCVAIERDVTGLSERNKEFSKLGVVVERPAHGRIAFEKINVVEDRFGGAAGGRGILLGEEGAADLEAARGPFGDDYSWQSGASVSASLPQVFSQSRNSSPVRWRPVS